MHRGCDSIDTHTCALSLSRVSQAPRSRVLLASELRRKVQVDLAHVELQNVGVTAKKAADVGYRASEISVYKLLNVGAGLRRQIHDEEVLVDSLARRRVDDPLAHRERSSVQYTDGRRLVDGQVIDGIQLGQVIIGDCSRRPDDAPLRVCEGASEWRASVPLYRHC